MHCLHWTECILLISQYPYPHHWSPESLPFPFDSEVSHGKGTKAQEGYSDGLHFPSAPCYLCFSAMLPSPRGNIIDELGHLSWFLFWRSKSHQSLYTRLWGLVSSALSGWDNGMTMHLERSQPLFAYSSRSQPALGQKPALIRVQAWEVMALINSCITIWISFSFGEKRNHFKTLIMLEFLKAWLNLTFVNLV